jgi:hypothetical protein
MSPFRRDVVLIGFVLAVPVLVLGVRGDLTADEVVVRLAWCLAAGYAAVALIKFAGTPRHPSPAHRSGAATGADPAPADEPADSGAAGS